jgi:hypothetical protein
MRIQDFFERFSDSALARVSVAWSFRIRTKSRRSLQIADAQVVGPHEPGELNAFGWGTTTRLLLEGAPVRG